MTAPGSVVRVLPTVAAIDKTFAYLVPERDADLVAVGTMVRVSLHGRRVGGWVVATDTDPPPGVVLTPLAKVTGLGPPPEIVDLARWVAWRWSGRQAQMLRTASPLRAVRALPERSPPERPMAGQAQPLGEDALDAGRAVMRLPPAEQQGAILEAAVARGPALVIAPSAVGAQRVVSWLRSRGVSAARFPDDWARIAAGGVTAVGTRAAVWAPSPELSAVIVLDEHDEAHQQERAPTWHAREVAAERARRLDIPCVLTSPTPTVDALDWGRVVTLSRTRERTGWPVVEVVDRRDEAPGAGSLFSARFVRLAREDGRVLAVVNRTGRARLLACAACGELARCERCDAAVHQIDDELSCRRCEAVRPAVCLHCGATRFKNLRLGVTRAREELEALMQEPVVEVTGATQGQALPDARMFVGTEAVLHQRTQATMVAFLDFDQELLAPRYRAAEQALSLLARAARIVGPRTGGGRVLVQTRQPDHEVVQAAVRADPSPVAERERVRRQELRFPPAASVATVSGEGAGPFIDRLGTPLGIEVLGPTDDAWLLRADDIKTLADGLAATPRPKGRLRVAVDPLRL